MPVSGAYPDAAGGSSAGSYSCGGGDRAAVWAADTDRDPLFYLYLQYSWAERRKVGAYEGRGDKGGVGAAIIKYINNKTFAEGVIFSK